LNGNSTKKYILKKFNGGGVLGLISKATIQWSADDI
jgi:hypothetical protein